jgi:hypothetical protein
LLPDGRVAFTGSTPDTFTGDPLHRRVNTSRNRGNPVMDFFRIVLNIGFWIIFSFVFDALSDSLVPDLSLEMWIYLWFFGLCAGTILFNLGWYWFRIRR